MTRILLTALGLVALFLWGCKHPIEIVGHGDVSSASGTRNCSLEDYNAGLENCSDNAIVGEYNETYIGETRPGWQFRRWGNYCGTALDNLCNFQVDAQTVASFQGAIVSPLQAIFRSTENRGFKTLLVGDSQMTPIAAGMQALAAAAGFDEHTTTTFFGEGDQGTPRAMWNNIPQRAAIQAVLDAGDIELFGMSFDSLTPTLNAYKKWINYALKSNPDTRFFISIPWNVGYANSGVVEYESAYRDTEQLVYGLVDALRTRYPGVDFYAIPTGRSAVELYTLFNEGNLPDVLSVVGTSGESIFQDQQGEPGEILVAVSQLAWLSAVYAIDLVDYDFAIDYTAAIDVIAQGIVDEQNPRYRAPPEIDTDTDGDGIVDRLDPSPNGRPNILVIMADDLGFNDLAINNDNADIDTPNMDQLARDGMRFTRHYGSAVCSPGRAAFLTGLYPERAGYLPNGRGMSSELLTLPERLQEGGYTTWHIGKWHIGDTLRTAWPDHQGFDHWFGFLNQWRLAGLHVDGELQLARPTYINPWLEGDTEPGKIFPGHLEDILTDRAIDVITGLNAAQSPWFLNLWFYAPHGPVQPASEFAAQYPETPAGRYRALVNQLDTNVGRIVAHLESIGALQNTIVVLVSDNGGTNAALDSNAPYFGVKTFALEGGLRTPLIIRWPDGELNGQVVSDAVGIQDIYPTLLDAVEIPASDSLDGTSFYSAIREGAPLAPKDLFWEAGGNSYSVLSADGRWRLYLSPPFGEVVFEPVLYDFTLDPTGMYFAVPTPLTQLNLMTDSYQAWYRDVHTVRTTYAQAANGSGQLTGMGFLRTPGFGGYTFGMGLPDEYSGPLAGQAGIWQMYRTGNTVVAQFGDISLSADIVESKPCHSIVISGNFERRLADTSGPDKMTLTMYIDGVATAPQTRDGILSVDDPLIITAIGDPLATADPVVLPTPVILNTALSEATPWTLESFSQELCSSL